MKNAILSLSLLTSKYTTRCCVTSESKQRGGCVTRPPEHNCHTGNVADRARVSVNFWVISYLPGVKAGGGGGSKLGTMHHASEGQKLGCTSFWPSGKRPTRGLSPAVQKVGPSQKIYIIKIPRNLRYCTQEHEKACRWFRSCPEGPRLQQQWKGGHCG